MLDGLSCGERLSAVDFAAVKARAVAEAFKWNLTERGEDTLCDFPLLLDEDLWRTLADCAVRLAEEAERAERELLRRPFLRTILGIPSPLRRALLATARAPGVRYSRFDFHPTFDGSFVITEGNLDVAGGWNEAGSVAARFAERVGVARRPDDPASALAEALARQIGARRTVGFMHLTRYADDHQVAKFVARKFVEHGFETVLFDPTQLRRLRRRAAAIVGDEVKPLDAVFRFFPAEWSCRLPNRRAWFEAVSSPETHWMNPLSTVLTQSKRFPLAWRMLRSPLPTWQKLMPETRHPFVVRAKNWVLKPALGHEGFHVAMHGVTDSARSCALWWRARIRPWLWAAQRPFRALPLETPRGRGFPCIGVYVVDGRPAGLYGRIAVEPLIDSEAKDVVILVRA
jgi:hypothetical protein